MDIAKALSTLNTGAYLIPEVVEPAIRDYIGKEPRLLNLVNHIPWATNTYFIRKRQSQPTVTWSTDGAALPAAQNSTYAKVSKSVKYVYARGEVTGPEQKAAGSLYDAMALEVEAQSRALAMDLSKKIADGTGASNEIEGIIHQIGTDPSMNALDSDGAQNHGGADTDAASAALTLAMLDEAIDAAEGEGDLIVTSRAVRRKINSLLQAQQQFTDRVEVAAGFRVLTYDGLPIVTDLNSESDTELAIVRRADCKLLVHQDWTFEPLAKTKDSDDFFIKGYFGFALEGRPVRLHGFTL